MRGTVAEARVLGSRYRKTDGASEHVKLIAHIGDLVKARDAGMNTPALLTRKAASRQL